VPLPKSPDVATASACSTAIHGTASASSRKTKDALQAADRIMATIAFPARNIQPPIRGSARTCDDSFDHSLHRDRHIDPTPGTDASSVSNIAKQYFPFRHVESVALSICNGSLRPRAELQTRPQDKFEATTAGQGLGFANNNVSHSTPSAAVPCHPLNAALYSPI